MCAASTSQSPAQVETGQEIWKDGTIWTNVQPGPLGPQSGRRQSQNILTENAGPTLHAKRNIDTPQSAFMCLVDRASLQHIRDCTMAEVHMRGNSSWDVSVEELKVFIVLLYVRGAYSKNIDMESFWSEEWGLPFFNMTMPRNRYREILRYLRFDNKGN